MNDADHHHWMQESDQFDYSLINVETYKHHVRMTIAIRNYESY